MDITVSEPWVWFPPTKFPKGGWHRCYVVTELWSGSYRLRPLDGRVNQEITLNPSSPMIRLQDEKPERDLEVAAKAVPLQHRIEVEVTFKMVLDSIFDLSDHIKEAVASNWAQSYESWRKGGDVKILNHTSHDDEGKGITHICGYCGEYGALEEDAVETNCCPSCHHNHWVPRQ